MSGPTRRATPSLPIFDVAETKAPHRDFRRVRLDREHSLEGGAWVYLEISSRDLIPHSSGHHGDHCPCVAVHLRAANLHDFRGEGAAECHRFKGSVNRAELEPH